MKFIFGNAEKLPSRFSIKELARGFFGGALGILILEILTNYVDSPFIMAPFGATCVILFTVAQSPLAQPRNVILGHFISALVGIIALKLFPVSIITISLAVGVAICSMQAFRCVHPPAGANPLVILLTANKVHYDWDFLLFPVLSGTIALVLVAYVINNIMNDHKWPVYWLAFFKTKGS
ncbi:hypothetical protein DTO96_101973 [Ephemeroptericola cinctiostellae]|uniref:HPP transmembrane region domain-containing protein n=1 Tax=Ephemeroptericola cinctiostellae TaxID=2268024 RepID=A0A345DCY9_9BURK|nr:HPP family protein [Ephemeroptericola cinctiostellae]AXF86227.1 hypothetical protein DTO96_101973 [Ephemeroptericola cinctiostellae]